MLPYWCPHCKTFLTKEDIVERVKDGDWGDYVAKLHKFCQTDVWEAPPNPRRMFSAIMATDQEFSRQDSRYQARVELAFMNALGDYRSGRMGANAAGKFEQAMKRPEDLMRFLVDQSYETKW